MTRIAKPDAVAGDVPPRRTVLVVDDDPAIRTWLTRSLEGVGYGVTTAHDQRSAEKVLLDAHVDAVIVDLRLGDDSGLPLVDFVRTHDSVAELPILMLTGVARMTFAEEQSIRHHHVQVSYKPAPIGEIEATLHRLCVSPR